MFQIGGPVGALCIGWGMDRWNKYRVLMTVFVLSGGVIYTIGQATEHFFLLCLIAWMVGFCLNGASVGMNALAANFYPTEARATGASWMSGIGRIGAILSAFAGAQMLSWGWTFAEVFSALVLPASLAALAIYGLGRSAKDVLADRNVVSARGL